ncbi:MAG: cobalamin-binding protein [Planctomycetota bacterium]|nr:cobalamin-binding protein [Planctomycetota bacterium]
MKIVSLLPSATEIICALGLEEELVGVTHECDFPAFVRGLPKVTRTLIPTNASSAEIDRLVREQLRTSRALYSLDLPTLEMLQPDLIVTQALCDVCAVAEEEVRAAACALPGSPRVVNLEPQNLSDVFTAIKHVAEAAGVSKRGNAVVGVLQVRVDDVVARVERQRDRPRVVLLEWLDPPFSSGHWNPELVRLAGGNEGLGREGERSRTLRWDEVIAWQPEVIVIACCGFDVERTLADVPLLPTVPGWQDLPAVRSGQVYVTDGSQFFNRPGPRLVDSLEILAHAINPQVHPLPAGLPPAVRVTDSFLVRK